MTIRRALPLAITAVLLLRAHHSAAEVPAVCAAPHELDKYKSLRRLSYDLRNRPPSFEEYEALEAAPAAVTDFTPMVQTYLGTTDYRSAMRRYHENQYWPNVSNVRLSSVNTLLAQRAPYARSNASSGRERSYRGLQGRVCADREQTAFDPAFPGEFRPTGVPVVGGAREEGWRAVRPYWDPTTEIQVCAYDAQESPSVVRAGRTVRCNSPEGQAEPGCGCGPNLRFCYVQPVIQKIQSSMREQLGRLADKVATGQAPYTDLVLARDIDEDGALAFWRKHLAPNASYALIYNAPLPDEPQAANPDFNDDAWHALKRTPIHSGILTMPAYLLRFQTDRGRANRLRIALMGQYFVPAAKLEPETGCLNEGPDLTKRCNCQYCHKILEPLASHFGNFAEAGSSALNDRTMFPLNRPECIGSVSPVCRRFYVTDADAPRPGTLLPYQFADVHPEYTDAIEKGPRATVLAVVSDGTFARTVVRFVLERLLKRDLQLEGERRDDLALVERLAREFSDGGYQFPKLVESVVLLPEYRRVR